MFFRTLLLFTGIAFVTFKASAQKEGEEEEDGFNGVRAGWYMSDIAGDVDETDARHGFYGGYYRNVIKIPLYRLSTGLEYHTAGASSALGSSTTELRLSYLSLPINNRLKLGPVYVDLGIDPALRLGEKWLVDGTEVDVPEGQEAERFDLLVHGCVGFKFLFLGVEARYRRGLLNVYDNAQNSGLEVGLCAFF